MLLQKMSDIIRKPSQSTDTGLQPQNIHRSLNRDSRRKELQRITNENQAILKRIQHAAPMYDHVRWEHEFRRTRGYLKNTCEFPVVLGPTHPHTLSIENERPSSAPSVGQPGAAETSLLRQQFSKQIVNAPVRPHVRCLVKDGQRIGETFYLIEVTTDGDDLWISAYSGQEDDAAGMEVHLDKEGHSELLKEVRGNYFEILNKIRITSGKLSLI